MLAIILEVFTGDKPLPKAIGLLVVTRVSDIYEVVGLVKCIKCTHLLRVRESCQGRPQGVHLDP
jgi:hypothetical protein